MQCQATESRNPQIDLFANTYNQSNIHARDNCSLPTTAVRNTQHLHARLRTYQKAMPHPTFNARDIRANTYNQSNVHARDNCSLTKPRNHATRSTSTHDHARIKRQYPPKQHSTRVIAAQRLRRSRDPSRKPVFLHLYHTDVSISLLAIA